MIQVIVLEFSFLFSFQPHEKIIGNIVDVLDGNTIELVTAESEFTSSNWRALTARNRNSPLVPRPNRCWKKVEAIIGKTGGAFVRQL